MESRADVFDARMEVSSEFVDDEWRRFVASAPDATPAHMIEWRDLIAGVFGYEPVYRVARRNGRVCGVLPAFLVRSALLGPHIISVPFLNWGGMCVQDEAASAALVEDARKAVKLDPVGHFEMRCSYPPPPGVPARQHKVRIVLDLPGSADDLWASLRGEIRNRTRRAENAGLRVEFGSSDVAGFYRVFAENMRDLGVPSHPMRFFTAVLRCVKGSQLVVVRDGDQVVGGAITLRFGDRLEVPWISCLRSRFEQCPNNILYWQMMKRACEDGIRTFDFGRSSPNTGPATFKMRWGARADKLYWHYILPEGATLPSETGSSNPRFRLASDLWKRTPRVVTDFLGPRLIAHLPG